MGAPERTARARASLGRASSTGKSSALSAIGSVNVIVQASCKKLSYPELVDEDDPSFDDEMTANYHKRKCSP